METEDERLHREFIELAQRRLEEMERTGEYITFEDFRDYALAIGRGEKPPPPVRRRRPLC